MIYADHAATTKLDSDALKAMLPFMIGEYANPSQSYSFSRAAKRAVRQARETIAKCINASPEEIYFTSGGSESDNWAIKSILLQKRRKKIVISNIEHHAVVNSCKFLQAVDNFSVDFAACSSKGIVEPSKVEEKLKESDVYLTSIMLANNELGTIQPIKLLAQIAHNHDSLFHTDAVQALGHISVDVRDLNVDMLSASAHKFNGPKGIGFLYVKKGTELCSLIDGGAQEYGFRAGTENVAAIVGMAYALQKNCINLDHNTKKLVELETELFSRLKALNIDFICNSGDKHIPGNLSLSFKGMLGEMLLHRLDLKGIMVSTGSACDGAKTQTSHVINALKVPEDYAKGTIRISLGTDNDITDIHDIANALGEIIHSS